MANLNIKLNAYFTPNLPERMLNAYDESSEALWFTSHDVLEYIESVGIKKESYIGLSSGPHLYIKANGRTIGFMNILEELLFSRYATSTRIFDRPQDEDNDDCDEEYKDELLERMESFIPHFQKVFEKAKEIYLKSEVSKDKTHLYQFSEEDTLMLLEKVFEHQEYIKFTK